jgi:hypothetical protein
MNIRKGTSTSTDPCIAARELHAALDGPMAIGIFYCAPTYDLDVLGAELARLFGEDAPLIGCTTAGEISEVGYLEGTLTGVALSGPDVVAHAACVEELRDNGLAHGEVLARETIRILAERGVEANGSNSFGLLLSDGLAMHEEALVSSLYSSLGNIQLIGGSAGDGLRFGATYFYHRGKFATNRAVFTLIHTKSPFRVFKTEHFEPTPAKMVVTEARPAQRIVTEINGLPAAREYARAVGLEITELTPMIFAANPVVVRIGGESYVRSIQKVNDDESLSFFCAIEEGIVLTVANGKDIVENLRGTFALLDRDLGPPELVLGCDCILRSIEIERRGCRDDIAKIFREHNVVGFATYGEQFNAMHVNQTFTGVAIGKR